MNNLHLTNHPEFNDQVWHFVREVPVGRVVTYGQIAQALDPPEGIQPDDYKVYGPRWVGDAMAACPDDVPWQRVVNSQGKISDRRGAMKQRRLLEDEGVEFAQDKIDLEVYQWFGEGREESLRQGRLF